VASAPHTEVQRIADSSAATIVFDPGVDETLAREWLVDHPRWFEEAGTRVPEAESNPDLVLLDSALGPVVAKRELPRGWKASLVRTGARPFKSTHAFRLARRLRWSGVATPEPLACITRPGRDACLLTRYVEAANPWTFALAQATPGSVRTLEQALARAISHLHARGFRHRDLKAPNLLARSSDDAQPPEILFTDLEGAAQVAVTASVRVRDLARLCMSFESAAARLAGVHADSWPRFVAAYLTLALGRAPVAREHAEFVARTRQWSTRSIERNLRRGRPIA